MQEDIPLNVVIIHCVDGHHIFPNKLGLFSFDLRLYGVKLTNSSSSDACQLVGK